MSQATMLNPDFVNKQRETLTRTLLGMPAFVPMAQSINAVSSDSREASKYERFADHSSPPPDIYLPTSPASKNRSPPPPDFHSPTSPESEHHTEEGWSRAISSPLHPLSPLCHLSPLGNLANPTDPTNDHWPSSEDLCVLSIQLRSRTHTLLIEDLDNCWSTMILLSVKQNGAPSTYAVLTGFSKEHFTVNELISAIISHPEMQYLLEQLLESFATSVDYSMLRAREAHAMESLDVWKDGCQVLDKLSTILIHMLSHCDERNIMTRVPSATLWGFPKMDLLYILYLVPEGPSLSAAPVTSRAPSFRDIQRCAAPSHLLPTDDESPIEGGALGTTASQWLKNQFPSIHTLSKGLLADHIGHTYMSKWLFTSPNSLDRLSESKPAPVQHPLSMESLSHPLTSRNL
ncbi:hypothetical protein K439DRAFT_1624820 [Ramaria rubella]|nr:hypothetical protein K439DRAFT_1624820 [Ramaria rubella]